MLRKIERSSFFVPLVLEIFVFPHQASVSVNSHGRQVVYLSSHTRLNTLNSRQDKGTNADKIPNPFCYLSDGVVEGGLGCCSLAEEVVWANPSCYIFLDVKRLSAKNTQQR